MQRSDAFGQQLERGMAVKVTPRTASKCVDDQFTVTNRDQCPSFVVHSSDKAVNPANVTGATKRLGELIISWRLTSLMRCVSVRFGIVLGSNGSVGPVLHEQIRDHQPLIIRHPDIVRFFMTTCEAVSLMLHGFAMGEPRRHIAAAYGRTRAHS
jgi:FlaA1/EpsC-like NDP-sugar epimerase